MSYNTTATAEGIVGQSITQALLDVAKSYLDTYSEYRWASTSITETFSGDNQGWIQLRSPIITITSLTMDDVSKTEDTDFEVRKIEGVLKVFSGTPFGHDNIVIIYTYGWQDSDSNNFHKNTIGIVKMVEAQVALYLKKNPLRLLDIGVEGVTLKFDDNHIQQLLNPLPKTITFTVLGGAELLTPLG